MRESTERVVGHAPWFDPVRMSLWIVETDRYACSQREKRGSPEARQDPETPPGRALRDQFDTSAREECETRLVDPPASTLTRAASSSGVGTPRSTLTSGSVSIDTAYSDSRSAR